MSVAVATAGVGVTLLIIVECVQSTLCAATVQTLCRRCLALVPSFAGCACEVSMLCVAFWQGHRLQHHSRLLSHVLVLSQ